MQFQSNKLLYPEKTVAHFWAKVQIGSPLECWQWLACTGRSYGLFFNGTKTIVAHRFAYELAYGVIEPNMTLDHLCRNTACVNPNHLEVVSMRENILRGAGPTAKNAAKTYCINGHAFSESNTYLNPRGDRICRICRYKRFMKWKNKHH